MLEGVERAGTAGFHARPGHWSVGAVLREAREAGAESILDISIATRIRPEYLYALEDETYHELPGWAYAISYVRAYAEYLSLDPRPLVVHVKEQLSLREHVMGPLYGGQELAYERRPSRGPRWFLLAVVALVGGIGAWYLASPASLAGLFAPVPAQLRVLVDRSFFAAAEGEEAAPPERAGLSLAPTAVAAPEVTRPQFAPLRDEGDLGPDRLVIATHPAGAIDHDGPLLPEITLRATGPTAVTVEDAAGDVLLAEELQGGALFRLPRERGLQISAADGGVIEVYFNGNLAGMLSGPGTPVERVAVERLVAGPSGGS
jgi:hypothetical protein